MAKNLARRENALGIINSKSKLKRPPQTKDIIETVLLDRRTKIERTINSRRMNVAGQVRRKIYTIINITITVWIDLGIPSL